MKSANGNKKVTTQKPIKSKKQQQNIRQIFKDVCQGKHTPTHMKAKEGKMEMEEMEKMKLEEEEENETHKISKSRRSKAAKENATCLMATLTHTHTKGDVKSKCRKNSFRKEAEDGGEGWGKPHQQPTNQE